LQASRTDSNFTNPVSKVGSFNSLLTLLHPVQIREHNSYLITFCSFRCNAENETKYLAQLQCIQEKYSALENENIKTMDELRQEKLR